MKLTSVDILPGLSIRIPTVGEIIDNEQHYYNLVYSLTVTPFQYMVQLDDMGIDFTKITDYQLFMMLFPNFAQGDISILFGNLDLSDISIYENRENNTFVLYSSKNNIMIDEFIYTQIADCIRKINCLKNENRKPGNYKAKKLRIKLERRKQKRNANKPYEPYLKKLVITLVNRPDFNYNYEQVRDLTIYQFYQILEQIKTSMNFGNIIIGVCVGSVVTTKIKGRSCLSWLSIK